VVVGSDEVFKVFQRLELEYSVPSEVRTWVRAIHLFQIGNFLHLHHVMGNFFHSFVCRDWTSKFWLVYAYHCFITAIVAIRFLLFNLKFSGLFGCYCWSLMIWFCVITFVMTFI
jgi:hypothetical protein